MTKKKQNRKINDIDKTLINKDNIYVFMPMTDGNIKIKCFDCKETFKTININPKKKGICQWCNAKTEQLNEQLHRNNGMRNFDMDLHF